MFKKIIVLGFVVAFLLVGIGYVSDVDAYQYRVTDPLVGSSISDINTAWWGVAGEYSITQNGFAVTGSGQSYLGYRTGLKWALRGDFKTSIYLSPTNSMRSHFGVLETTDLTFSTTSANYGYWGGSPDYQPVNQNYPTAFYLSGGSGYFLFKKEGNSLKIFKGDGLGVDESDPIVVQTTVVNENNYFIVYGGRGAYQSGSFLIRDFVLETDELIPLGSYAPPVAWLIEDDSDTECQAQLAVLEQEKDALEQEVASLNADKQALLGQVGTLQSENQTLQEGLNAANLEISSLESQITVTDTALAEIQALISTPQGRRTSASDYSGAGVLGGALNDILKILLAPPGQNIRSGSWKE